MKSQLIVVQNQADQSLVLLHVDEIRSVTPHEGGARILTASTGVLIVDDLLEEIMRQYLGTLVPDFIPEQCVDCTAAELETERAAKINHAMAVRGDAPPNSVVVAGPTLKDLIDLNLSVRAINIAEAAFPPESKVHEEGVDPSTISLTPILGISESEWAARKNSTPEVAQQIVAAIRKLTMRTGAPDECA